MTYNRYEQIKLVVVAVVLAATLIWITSWYPY